MEKQRLVQKEDMGDTSDLTTTDIHPVVPQTLLMPEILEKIFHNFLPHELLPIRSVDKTWSQVTTQVWQSRQDHQIAFQFSVPPSSNFVLWKDREKHMNKTLQKFSKLFHTPSKFQKLRLTHFEFALGNLGRPECLNFFTKYGPNIKKLSIFFDIEYFNPNFNYTKRRVVGHLLKDLLPNLEHFRLSGLPPNPWSYSKFFEQTKEEVKQSPGGGDLKKIELPKLRSLDLQLHILDKDWVFEIVQELVLAAVNLDRYEEQLGVPELEFFLSSERAHAIKKFKFTYTNSGDLDLLEKFANLTQPSPPQLESLYFFFQVDMPWFGHLEKRAFEILEKVLLICRESLKHLKFYMSDMDKLRRLMMGSELQLKKLTKVTMISYNSDGTIHDGNEEVCRWPTFYQHFPALSKVIVGNEADDRTKEDLFPHIGVVESVKILGLKEVEASPNLLKKLFHTFPRIETLHLDTDDFPTLAETIWTGPKLTCLEIWLHISNEEGNRNLYPMLDAAFCGLEPETVKSLEEGEEWMDVEDVEKLRKGPSLVDQKDLKELKLFLIALSNKQPNLLMSEVVGMYALDLLPNLSKVRIDFDGNEDDKEAMEDGLDALRAYVHFGRFDPSVSLYDL